MPNQPLPGTQASAQLRSHIAVSNYDDGLPLYRQEKIAAQEGIDLARSKQARWITRRICMHNCDCSYPDEGYDNELDNRHCQTNMPFSVLVCVAKIPVEVDHQFTDSGTECKR